jgi:hypothetical protein
MLSRTLSGLAVTSSDRLHQATMALLPTVKLLFLPLKLNLNGTNFGSSTVLNVVTMISNGIPPSAGGDLQQRLALPGIGLFIKKSCAVPLPW